MIITHHIHLQCPQMLLDIDVQLSLFLHKSALAFSTVSSTIIFPLCSSYFYEFWTNGSDNENGLYNIACYV